MSILVPTIRFILQLPLIALVVPVYTVCCICKNIENAKTSIERYKAKQELIRKNPDHCVRFYSTKEKDTIYILENDIFERAHKSIHLRTGKLVYLTEKSNRILPVIPPPT